MDDTDLVIGLDCSTTACKAVIWNHEGNLVSAGHAPLSMIKPKSTWHEQSAEDWWVAAIFAIRQAVSQVNRHRIAALCIAPQRETFVITDSSGRPKHNALLWMDERCRSLLTDIDQVYPKAQIHKETGKPLSANLSTGKLYWLAKYHPDICHKDNQINDVHAYLCRCLTGKFVTSWACADPMGLFDMHNFRWNEPLIEAVGFRVSQFPEAVRPGTNIGSILPQVARDLYLPYGIPLIAGLGDGQAAGLGVNVTKPGDAYLNLGTAVVSGTLSREYLFDSAFRTMYSGTPGFYFLETVLLGGTYTINWFLEHFSDKGSVSQLTELDYEKEAAQIKPGADGLILVPYWNSAMNPYWDASASGIIAGWRGIHGRAHLYRAILEGIAFEQRLHTHGVEAVLGHTVEKFIAVGGGSRSPLWLQIISDVTQKVIQRADSPEATALGAGILAATASGFYSDVQSAARAMSKISSELFFPNNERAAFYDVVFNNVYKQFYPSLRPYLSRLADISANY